MDDADLGDRFALGGAAGGLDVDEGEAAGKAVEGGRQGWRRLADGSRFERAWARRFPCRRHGGRVQRTPKPASSIA